jgi:hypothetical protein
MDENSVVGPDPALHRPTPLEPQHCHGIDLEGFLTVAPQHNPPQQPQRPRWRNRAENGQRDRDLWPRGYTARENHTAERIRRGHPSMG